MERTWSGGSGDAFQQGSYSDSGSEGGIDQHAAMVYCQQLVRKRLVSPSTADFAGFGDSSVTAIGDGRWRVESYVDSQNRMGGMIRTRFSAVMSRIDGGWEMHSLATTP